MRSLKLVFLISSLLASAACGGGDDDAGHTHPDATTEADAGDLTPVDADVGVDATLPDASPDPDAAVDAPHVSTPSELIAAARAAGSGAGLSLPIHDATVTYIKPQIGSTSNDPAGFTIQADQTGPALFVEIDPATLTPAPAVGGVVQFTITEMGTTGGTGIRAAKAITDFSVAGTAADVNALVQNLTAATDVVTALDSYESELIDVNGTVTGTFGGAGGSYEQAAITTEGVAADTNLRIRVVSAVRDALDLVQGCSFSLDNVPVHRFGASAQLPAYKADELTLSNCPAPAVVTAVATSANAVRITFSRRVLPSSLTDAATQFTFDNGLTASAAEINGREVILTTSAQASGTTYAVTVSGITDLQGTAIGATATSTFVGFGAPQAVVRINELNANIGTSADSCDLIELRVVSGGSIGGYVLRERTSDVLVTFPQDFSVEANDLILVHVDGGSTTCNPNGATRETADPAEQAAAMYAGNRDTAFDWYSTDSGLTNTDNVFTLYNGANEIVDAVFVSNDPAGPTAAAATETQAAAVGAVGQWLPTLATYIDTVFRTNAVDDLDGTGTDAAGSTIQRLCDGDTNQKTDWTTGAGVAATWGELNEGQRTPVECAPPPSQRVRSRR